MRAEKPAAGENAAGQQGGKPRAAPAQPHEQIHAERPPPEVTDGVGEQGIREAQPGEEQAGWIEHAALDVGQERAAKEKVGIPERDVPGGQTPCSVGLQRIEVVDEIKPGDDAGAEERVPKEERDETTQGEQGQCVRQQSSRARYTFHTSQEALSPELRGRPSARAAKADGVLTAALTSRQGTRQPHHQRTANGAGYTSLAERHRCDDPRASTANPDEPGGDREHLAAAGDGSSERRQPRGCLRPLGRHHPPQSEAMQCGRLVGRLRQQLRGAGTDIYHLGIEVVRQAGQGAGVLDGGREIAQAVRQALRDGLPARPYPALREVIKPGAVEAPASTDDCLEAVVSRP